MAGDIFKRNDVVARIVTPTQAIHTAKKLILTNSKIVLAGGCFDVLHKGHVSYLKSSKKKGEILFLLLESDENITLKKGKGRPINKQKMRAKNLEKLGLIDYIVCLGKMTKDSDYDTLVSSINPKVITATEGDEALKHARRQSEKINADLRVIEKVKGLSSTEIIKKYGTI